MNLAIFIGRTTKDIELQQTQKGTSYARFSLAVDSGYGDNKKTDFFNMIVWSKPAEAMANYVIKGTKIAVTCEAHQNSYTNKEGAKVNTVDFTVRNWEFAQNKGDNQGGGNDSAPVRPTASAADDGFMSIPDSIGEEELPFS